MYQNLICWPSTYREIASAVDHVENDKTKAYSKSLIAERTDDFVFSIMFADGQTP